MEGEITSYLREREERERGEGERRGREVEREGERERGRKGREERGKNKRKYTFKKTHNQCTLAHPHANTPSHNKLYTCTLAHTQRTYSNICNLEVQLHPYRELKNQDN